MSTNQIDINADNARAREEQTPTLKDEILKWMNAYIPRGKTVPVFEDMLEQYAATERTALLTELRDSELLEEKEYSDEGDKQSMKYRNHNELGHNTLARNIKAHLDELIKSNRLELDNP